MKNIKINRNTYLPINELPVEIVERKGKGHPDTLIDGIMEEISKELSKYYLEEVGFILHHNVDKGQINAGASIPSYGGGKTMKPMYILLSGRATEKAGDITIPVHKIAIQTAKEYLHKTLKNIEEGDYIIDSRISPGSVDLVSNFNESKGYARANDTSFGVGYAPFSRLESAVLKIEEYLNSEQYKKKMPMVGEDVKVMGLREKTNGSDNLKITVAIAFVDKYLASAEEYYDSKKKIEEDLRNLIGEDISISVNTADIESKKGKGGEYITVTGTSAEMGDDGSVGRGNRVNGLITPYRSMTLEAAAGKNPVNHVGKLYSVLSFRIAEEIHKAHPELTEVEVYLLSQIGKPINEPKVASVDLKGPEDAFNRAKKEIEAIIEHELDDIDKLTMEIVEGKVRIY